MKIHPESLLLPPFCNVPPEEREERARQMHLEWQEREAKRRAERHALRASLQEETERRHRGGR